MKILVTGANGFIGKNLIANLKHKEYTNILEYDLNTNPALLDEYCKEADFIYHLAGVNRPKDQSEFMKGNFGLTFNLIKLLKKHNNRCPVMFSSSIQASLDNPYGRSKKAGEDLVLEYGMETGSRVLVYRFPNVFGKWCNPNYNSAVATFCFNIANDLEIYVKNRSTVLKLVYIDDVINELKRALHGNPNISGNFCEVPEVYSITLGEIVDLILSFKRSRIDFSIPNMGNEFTKKLYSTYLSYLPKEEFSYELSMKEDVRGSFTEFLKTSDRGQVSVNILRPGVVKGNHWHNTKNEKFLVVSGKGVIRLRKVNTDEIIEIYVSGDKLEVVDIPTGYTHNIENVGDIDMVTVMWANENFNPEKLDTIFLEV